MQEDLWTSKDTETAEIKQKLADLESQIGAINPRNLGGVSQKALRAATRANIYGDGSDGNITFDGTTDLNTFSSRVGTVYTLTRDLFGKNVVINSGVTVKGGGFRVFVSQELKNSGSLNADGGDGGAGTDGGNGQNGGGSQGGGGGGGTAGTLAHNQGSYPATLAGAAGGAGSNGRNSAAAATAGSNGSNVTKSLGAAGVGGGGGVYITGTSLASRARKTRVRAYSTWESWPS